MTLELHQHQLPVSQIWTICFSSSESIGWEYILHLIWIQFFNLFQTKIKLHQPTPRFSSYQLADVSPWLSFLLEGSSCPCSLSLILPDTSLPALPVSRCVVGAGKREGAQWDNVWPDPNTTYIFVPFLKLTLDIFFNFRLFLISQILLFCCCIFNFCKKKVTFFGVFLISPIPHNFCCCK